MKYNNNPKSRTKFQSIEISLVDLVVQAFITYGVSEIAIINPAK